MIKSTQILGFVACVGVSISLVGMDDSQGGPVKSFRKRGRASTQPHLLSSAPVSPVAHADPFPVVGFEALTFDNFPSDSSLPLLPHQVPRSESPRGLQSPAPQDLGVQEELSFHVPVFGPSAAMPSVDRGTSEPERKAARAFEATVCGVLKKLGFPPTHQLKTVFMGLHQEYAKPPEEQSCAVLDMYRILGFAVVTSEIIKDHFGEDAASEQDAAPTPALPQVSSQAGSHVLSPAPSLSPTSGAGQ